ncbi:MAG: penicillin-binding protein 1C [Bacteroidetes bacterium]|nr:penicillin-binding protein 1C [Bacteroidota bacterium]
MKLSWCGRRITGHSILIAVLCLGLLAVGSVFIPFPADELAPMSVHSFRVLDRNGILLREYLNDQQGRGQWRTLDRIAPSLAQAIVAAEDHRFASHPGVDPIAVVRAVWSNLNSSRRSGASTITQQVVRAVRPRERTVVSKAVEAWDALRLERTLSKPRILEQYLNRAPFGNQLFGAEAAARHYFGKPALDLSVSESAALAALPNAPSALNPYRDPGPVLRRRNVILRRMLDLGMLGQEEFERALAQPVPFRPAEANFRAPHAVEYLRTALRERPEIAEVRSSIDARMHATVQSVMRTQLGALADRHVTNAAVVVIEHATGAVRVLAGSANFFDEDHQGQVNGTMALRQPGSSIKPLTYGAALSAGLTAATIIPDVAVQIAGANGAYAPENYDRRFHGPVRLRTALACSYNIPAVRVARDLGLQRIVECYRAAGLTTLTEPADHYGFGLTLGNADVRLLELANAYAAIARGGIWKPVTFAEDASAIDGSPVLLPASESERQVMPADVAAILADILSDPVARRPAFGSSFSFPFACAVKTGTTKDFRDNWTLGFTTRYTVGVWAGNFDGTPMRGVSGVSGAGAIFFDVMMDLHDPRQAGFPEPFPLNERLVSIDVCARSGLRPTADCVTTIREQFIPGTEPEAECSVHRRFTESGPGGERVERVYEFFGEEYREWGREEGIPVPPPDARLVQRDRSAPLASRAIDRPTVLQPSHGDHFKLDPVLRSQYQTVLVRTSIPPTASTADLVVNGRPLAKVEDGRAWWPLQRGVHRLEVQAVVQGRTQTSRPVVVTVE